MAEYLAGAVRMRPLAWSDSFGFRHVVTRSRDITDASQLAGLKIRTIQTPIYVKAVELMGASPTPMAFGEVYTSLQTGVIDGFEHDANTTIQQRFYEIAGFMARTGHIAGVLGLWASTASLARLPADVRAAIEGRRARSRTAPPRCVGRKKTRTATEQLAGHGMTIREIDRTARCCRPPSGSGRPKRARTARCRGSRPSARERPFISRPPPPRASTPRCNGPLPPSSWHRPRSSGYRSSGGTSCISPFPGPKRSRACCWRG